MYQDLLEMERKLDWTMTRKKVEVQDALVKTPTVHIDLRYIVSDWNQLTYRCRLLELCEYF